MNITKYITILLFSLIPIINHGQVKIDLNCEDGFTVFQTETKPSKSISYKIVYSQKSYTKDSSKFYEGFIVLSELIDRLSPQETMEAIAKIGVINKLNRIVAFRTCLAVEIYVQKTERSFEQEKHLKNNTIGNLKIDLDKTLSKKEKKQYVRKSKLIKTISEEICIELKQLDSNKPNTERLAEVLSKIVVKNIKDVEKVYKKDFDEIYHESAEDVLHQLRINCEYVKPLFKKSE